MIADRPGVGKIAARVANGDVEVVHRTADIGAAFSQPQTLALYQLATDCPVNRDGAAQQRLTFADDSRTIAPSTSIPETHVVRSLPALH
jgi:hypothetical protein